MAVPLINLMIDKLTEHLGDRQFFTIRDLYSIGFFGTMHAARMALKQGYLPFIRVSPRRCVIPREALMKFLRDNLREDGGIP